RVLAIEIFPFRTLGVFLMMVNVTLIQRLRISPMMGSFLRGDLSPEEVWAWRSHEQSANPALLLSFDGRIKRFNPAAAELAALHGERLALACLPKLGAKAETLSLEDPNKGLRTFEAEWPNAHAPIVILRDVTDAESQANALRRQLLTDELTGTANRRGFDNALQLASASDQPYAVYFLDMNGFKAVNDTHGHDAGDELLVRTARRLSGCVRPSDTVARLGGDEFAIVVNGTIGEMQAAKLAEKLAAAIDAPFQLDTSLCEVGLGVAVGYARSEEIGNDPAELLRRADKAMYRDKLRGKLKAAA
ncbi:MAG: putative diguanylate cyclase YeaP, partial [Pseudomonadota bacterium]